MTVVHEPTSSDDGFGVSIIFLSKIKDILKMSPVFCSRTICAVTFVHNTDTELDALAGVSYWFCVAVAYVFPRSGELRKSRTAPG